VALRTGLAAGGNPAVSGGGDPWLCGPASRPGCLCRKEYFGTTGTAGISNYGRALELLGG